MVVHQRAGRAAVALVLAFVVTLVLSVTVASVTPRVLASPTGAVIVTFNVQVDPGSADYVQRAAQAAIAGNEDLVIVMNTPGGLLGSMTQIVGSIADVQSHGLAVYTFVPPAALAASAGSYIALATNAIYMGSGSFIGPSTPYIIGGDPLQQQHVQNAMVAYISSLAQKNGYNVSAAANMAQNNVAYTAVDAASIGLVTGLTDTLSGFLSKVGLSGVPTTSFSEPVYDRFLSFVSDPTVDGLFILVGMIALVLDLFHRTLFMTVVAVIMIALGFLGAGVIGAQPVAILVLLIAAALIFIEVKAGHGLFALSGILLGLLGTYLLAYGVQWSPSPFGAAQYAILGVVAGLMAVAFIYLSRIRRILMRQPKLIDPGLIVNKTGRASTDIGPGQEGVANVGAEDWTAVSDESIEKGAWVQVTSYAEGKVHVRKAPSSGIEPNSPESSKSA
jgi:membrane-bound serine protease (ClpP class)